MLKLELKFKNTVIRELLTDKDEISVGRDASNDLCIDNVVASSRHARIFKGPGKYAIEDLNSTNGTYINNKQVRTQLLDENDEITIGKHMIRITYQKDESFEEQVNSGNQSTYMLGPDELKKLMQE
jgi:pSer/pThr/pTyr-binding forkhead associated (FHA) protein